MRKSTRALGALLLGGLVAGCATKEETSLKIYVQQKLYDKAITQGKMALLKEPNNGDTHYFLGAAYYGKDQDLKPEAEGYADSAAAYIKMAYDHFVKAKELAAGAWGKSVDDNIRAMFGRHNNRGVVAAKKDENDVAAMEYRLATIADPDDFNGYYAHAGALWMLAKEALKSKEEAEFSKLGDVILTDLEKVLALKPAEREVQVAVYQLRGEVLYRRHEGKAAQEAYAEAVKLDPENYGLMATMAERFYNEQDWENAEKYFEDALAVQERLNLIEESDAELYEALATARVKMSKRDEAIEAYQKALELKPNDEATMYNIMVTHYKAGEALATDGKMDEAKDRFSQGIAMGNELIRINSNKPEYWQVIGYCKRGLGDTGGAARDLKRFNDLRNQQQAK